MKIVWRKIPSSGKYLGMKFRCSKGRCMQPAKFLKKVPVPNDPEKCFLKGFCSDCAKLEKKKDKALHRNGGTTK